LPSITAKDGRNVQAALDMTQHLFKQANERVGPTGRLNAAIEQIYEERVPTNPAASAPKSCTPPKWMSLLQPSCSL